MRVISQIHTTTAHIHSILAVRFLSFNVEIAAHRKFIHFFVINFQLLKQQEEKKNKRFILSCHTTQKKKFIKLHFFLFKRRNFTIPECLATISLNLSNNLIEERKNITQKSVAKRAIVDGGVVNGTRIQQRVRF